MLLVIALVIFLLFAGLGFVSHVLWLGVLVGLFLGLVHMLRSGVDRTTRVGRLNLRLLAAVREYLNDVVSEKGRQARREARDAAPRRRRIVRRAGGRGRVMTPAKIVTVRELADHGVATTDIAEQVGVSPSTVRRYTTGDHAAAPPD